MTTVIVRWVLARRVRPLAVWSVALIAVCALYAGFYPLMGDTLDLESLISSLPEEFTIALGYDRIGTAAGYIESTVFGLLGVALMLVFGIGVAARVIAGEEEAGVLELETSAPVSRRSVLLQRYVAMVVQVALLGSVVGATVAVVVTTADLDVVLRNVVTTSIAFVLFVLAMASVTFAVGAATGRRAAALGVGSAVAVAAFVADAILPLLDVPDWALHVSPFSWYIGAEPLAKGADVVGMVGLAVLAALSLVVALVTYERRDLGV